MSLGKRMISSQEPASQLDLIASRAYALIAESFPVCSVSDEFYFFPQVVPVARHWSAWDDFSADRVASVAARLDGFEAEISHLSADEMTVDERLDSDMVDRALRTLREQLLVVSTQSTQPTFHLTVFAAGLGEALAANEQGAWLNRVAGAPAFLLRAADSLDHVPELFLRLGLDMLEDLQCWLRQLQAGGISVGELPLALYGFESALKKIKVVENYRLPGEIFEKVVNEHLDCGLHVDAAWSLLNDELQTMESLLMDEASRLAAGGSWVEAQRHIPFIDASGGGLLNLYLHELASMEEHCRQQGLIPDTLPAIAALEVAAVPHYLAAIRASDAYSCLPGYPPRGGTFFVMEHDRSPAGCPGRTLEYRMTAAHEVWPGHHLLDSCRWNLDRPLRSPLESPLFYEGWACLAEELLARTGYFSGPWDRFLLAKRRAERAARGLVDLGLQSGRLGSDQAVELLVRVGYRQQTARSVIPKYLLRPGYQVCYTLGLKQGLDLFERFGKENVSDFSQKVLKQGEIGFERLEKSWL